MLSTTFVSLTPTSRQNLSTKSLGDTGIQGTGTNWIWFWLGHFGTEMGETLLPPLLQRGHRVAHGALYQRMPTVHERARCRTHCGGAQQGHIQLSLWQDIRQWWHSPRPHQALKDHPTAAFTWNSLSVLERGSSTTGHEGCQGRHFIQKQGWKNWLQQLHRHFPYQRHRQNLCLSPSDPLAEGGWAHLPRITVWLPSQRFI